MTAKVYSVSQINNYVKNLLEEDILLNGFFVEAEISNFKAHSSGHFYFTIKDKQAALSCVMFKGYAAELPFVPEDGMNVILYGKISVYEKTGQYQLYVEMLEPQGKGSLYAAFEQLKKKLESEGLFLREYKKEIPENPKCIAVITSPTGAAVRDIINVSRRRNKSIRLVVVPVSVQGKTAGAEIAAAVEMVNEWNGADIIIVGRGGGSIEDLWAFNEEIVARAIFKSKIPVISAVGHETDFTISDFAADLRAATPSAAAELATPDLAEMINRVYGNSIFLNRIMMSRLEDSRQRFLNSNKDLGKAIDYYMVNIRKNLEKKLDGLHKVSPINVLKRGYCLAYDMNNQALTQISQIAVGDHFKLHLTDGQILANVKEVKND